MGTMCTCEEIERGTHACRASKLGPVERWWTQDGKLGITIQDPPPESGRRTHLLYFYLFILYYITCQKNLLLRCLFYVTMNMYFYFWFYMSTLHVTFVTVVFILAKYLSRYLHIFTCTYRDTYTQAHMYN